MTVKELIELLKKEDPGRLVVMSRDEEGNGYSPLGNIETAAYRADGDCGCGEIGLEPGTLTDELRKAYYSEEDVIEDGVPALVLWPE